MQRLLDYTEQLLDVERATLSDMNAVLRGFINELETMQAERVRISREYAEKNAAGTTPTDMEMYRNYIRNLDEEIFNKESQIEMQRRVVSKQEDRVREVNMDIKTMENLRERKLEEYNYLDNKEQELFIEEFVSNAKATALSI